MIQVAKINISKFDFTDLEQYTGPIVNTVKGDSHSKYKSDLNNYIWNQIKNNIKFHNITVDDLLGFIAENVYTGHLDEKYGIATETVLDTPKKIYVMSYYHLDVNETNELGSLFSPKKKIINSNVILYAYNHDINSEDCLKHCDVNENDLLRISQKMDFILK